MNDLLVMNGNATMSRDKNYQRLLNSKRWWEVKRIVWQRANGLCQRCLEAGRVTAGVDCHHLRPVESAKTADEMERLCYNPDNCQLLCVACHIQVHKEALSHTTRELKENRQRREERWLAHLKDKFQKKED